MKAALPWFALVCLVTRSVAAHAPALSHDVIVQTNADATFVVWVSARVGRGERIAWLEVQWDRNHDGALDATERHDGAAGLAAALAATLWIEVEGTRVWCPTEHIATVDGHELWLHVMLTCLAADSGSVALTDAVPGRVLWAKSSVGAVTTQTGETLPLPWLRRVEWVRQ